MPSEREELHDRLHQHIERAVKAGAPPETLARANLEAARKAGELVAAETLERARAAAASERAAWGDFSKALRHDWGEALDAFCLVVSETEQIARQYHQDQIESAGQELDRVFEVLMDLLSRACRTSFEVYSLLRFGQVAGAEARARTLHEIAVVAGVMQKYGRTTDVVERYQSHKVVDQWEYVRKHQEAAEVDGREPFSDDVVQGVRAEHRAIKERYGGAFMGPWGWARFLLPEGEPWRQFATLEQLVGLERMRSSYRATSQHVHPLPWGADLGTEGGALVSRWRTTGLAAPADIAMVALHQTAASALLGANNDPFTNQADLIYLTTLQTLSEHVARLLVEAEDKAAGRLRADNPELD